MRIILVVLFGFILINEAFAQEEEGYQMQGFKKEYQIDFLSSYYNQDGNNAAVTGGTGTEKLTDISNMVVVSVPLDSTQAINLSVGADIYSSASTDNIDRVVSSASSQDVRAYGNLAYTKKHLATGQTYGAKIGFSTEYDYTSFSAGLNWAKEFNEGNSELALSALTYVDQWQLIFPFELRRNGVNVPTNKRQSYNFSAVYSQVLNKRVQMSLSAELTYMSGLLSTPFHRVYFDDSNVDIERLPDARLKVPVSLRLNASLTESLIFRGYYRFYTDDFGIQAHTASAEIPIKLSQALTVHPFIRFHTQTAADYFAPFETHTASEQFYTSDYDLSGFESMKYGLGFRYAPLYGLARGKIFDKILRLEEIGLRGAIYNRSDGLNAFTVTLGLKLKM